MRKFAVFSMVTLATLFLGLGAFAQPKINITVPQGFVSDYRGCIEITTPGTVWAITGGAWARKEVRDYLVSINPFLGDPDRQFDWRGNGPNSGVRISAADKEICGFASTTIDADLELSSLNASDIAGLRAERDKAIANETLLARTLFVVIALLVSAIIISVCQAKGAARHHSEEAEQQQAHQTELNRTVDNGIRALTRQRQEHRQELDRVHSLYNPYDGEPVIPGGLQPTWPDQIAAIMLLTAYEDHPIAEHLSYETAVATGLFRRIGPIEYGLMNGHVVMRNGDTSRSNKILRNQPGYRTTIRLPDGTEMVVYSLQACCNPVLTGNWMEGAADDFTFTLMAVNSEIAPAPTPTVTGRMLAELGEPTQELTTADGGVILVFGDPRSFSVNGDENSLTLTAHATHVDEPVSETAITV
jgi:hypothetical protein